MVDCIGVRNEISNLHYVDILKKVENRLTIEIISSYDMISKNHILQEGNA